MPNAADGILKPQFERLEIEIKQILDAFAECFQQGECRPQLPVLDGALATMDQAVQISRDRGILATSTLKAPLGVLALIDRYHAAKDALDECRRLLCRLRLQYYWGDYFL